MPKAARAMMRRWLLCGVIVSAGMHLGTSSRAGCSRRCEPRPLGWLRGPLRRVVPSQPVPAIPSRLRQGRPRGRHCGPERRRVRERRVGPDPPLPCADTLRLGSGRQAPPDVPQVSGGRRRCAGGDAVQRPAGQAGPDGHAARHAPVVGHHPSSARGAGPADRLRRLLVDAANQSAPGD